MSEKVDNIVDNIKSMDEIGENDIRYWQLKFRLLVYCRKYGIELVFDKITEVGTHEPEWYIETNNPQLVDQVSAMFDKDNHPTRIENMKIFKGEHSKRIENIKGRVMYICSCGFKTRNYDIANKHFKENK